MKYPRIFPSNKIYGIVLCCILAGSALFLYDSTTSIEMMQAIGENTTRMSTLRGMPIVEENGKTLLWAGKNIQTGESKWWDATDALINIRNFDHGLGADRIASIDAPMFAAKDHPFFQNRDLTNLSVIGVEYEGEARAYPIQIMNRHELVNDTFGKTHLTVAW